LKSQFDVYEKKTITHRNGRMKFEHYNWRNCSSWQNPPDYDVSGITCDRDRNLKELKRQMNGNYVDFEYSHAYGTESNRMEWVVEWNNQEMIDLTHDRNGNMTSITGNYGIVSAWYDWRNLALSYSTDDNFRSYKYDHLGNRTYKSLGSTRYIRGAFGEVLTVYTSSSVEHHNILRPDGTVIGRREGSDRFYYHRDHLGSTRAVVNASGTVVETQDYYPFGLQMPGRIMTTGNSAKEKFTSHELDDEVDLYYMVARRYAPEFGRFLSVDPLADEFPGWSSYNYTLNNPINLFDPDGQAPCCLLPIGVAETRDNVAAAFGDKQAQQRVKTRLAGRAAVASLFIPGPEDLALGAFLVTKAGRATLRLADEAAGFVKGLFRSGDEVAKQIGDVTQGLKDIKAGKGDFGLGEMTIDDARKLGEAFVGPDSVPIKKGDKVIGFRSEDGTKVFRFPAEKTRGQAAGKVQANIEEFTINAQGKKKQVRNAHIDIID